MSWDVLLYSKRQKCFCGVKSVSIIEELGNVNFIFSDKTGTLTKNQLQFKFCIINKSFYKFVKHGNKKIQRESVRSQRNINEKKIEIHKNSLFNLLLDKRKSRRSDIFSKLQINTSHKKILSPNDESSIKELNKNMKDKKNSYSNNNLNNPKFSFLRKM